MRSGRTIGEKRERLETASERAVTKKKAKKRQIFRFSITAFGFVLVAAVIAWAISALLSPPAEEGGYQPTIELPYSPTIEVIDEDAGNAEALLSSSMKEYIGQAEADFRELGYHPTKAVRPAGSIREIDFYLDGYTGFIKFTTDRGTGVSVEDADRMIRYLSDRGISDFQYIDVRLPGQAYWK